MLFSFIHNWIFVLFPLFIFHLPTLPGLHLFIFYSTLLPLYIFIFHLFLLFIYSISLLTFLPLHLFLFLLLQPFQPNQNWKNPRSPQSQTEALLPNPSTFHLPTLPTIHIFSFLLFQPFIISFLLYNHSIFIFLLFQPFIFSSFYSSNLKIFHSHSLNRSTFHLPTLQTIHIFIFLLLQPLIFSSS